MTTWTRLINRFPTADRPLVEAIVTQLNFPGLKEIAETTPKALDLRWLTNFLFEGKPIPPSKRIDLARRLVEEANKIFAGDSLEPGDEPASSASDFDVRGVVRHGDGRPYPKAVVRAYDQGLRKRAPLGETRTDDAGRYHIGYDRKSLLDPTRASANLIVEVVEDDTPVAKSEVRFKSRPLETVDLIIHLDAGLNEWDRLRALLNPALQGLALRELAEDDLAFLQRSTVLPAQQLNSVWLAEHLAGRSGLPGWFHFALLRQGQPADLGALLDVPEARLRDALKAAAKAGSVSPPDEKDVAAAWHRFAELHTDHVLDKPVSGSRLKVRELLGEVFHTASLKPEQQRLLAVALASRPQISENKWLALQAEAALDARTVQRVQFTLQTAELADDHLPTVVALQRDDHIVSLRDLAKHYDLAKWQALVTDAAQEDGGGLPAGLEGDTPEARRSNFARQLYERVAAAHPTVALAHGLAREKTLAEHPAAKWLALIVDNDPAFDLATVRLDPYLKAYAGIQDLPEAEQEQVNEALKGVQRLYRLKPDAAVVGLLLADKLDSSAAILRQGRHGFVEKYGQDDLFGRDTAAAIYQQAETNAAKAFALYAHFSPTINSLRDPAAISKCPDELKAVPHFAALFGTLDGCECEPCESVFSPAAYLADLLAFLKTGVVRDPNHSNASRVPANGLKALETRTFCNGQDNIMINVARRPDIADTLLSCRNAETLVPYVDLVLENLEHAVKPVRSSAPQTTLPAVQLAAQPEHVNDEAYRILADAIFPFSLPFDLAFREEAIYLEHLGTTRAELLETFYAFRTGDPAAFVAGDPHDLTELRREQDPDIARARLGLNRIEWALIANEQLTPQRFGGSSWGYPATDPDWWRKLRNVDTLLVRSGLDYKDFLRLLRLKSFNPDGALKLRPEDAGQCDPKKMELAGLDDAAALTYLSRFLRLQRALGWTLADVDLALLALAPTTTDRPVLDGMFLTRLSHVLWLQGRCRLPLAEILSWWSPLDTADRSLPQLTHEQAPLSLYERLFQSGRPGEASFDAFQLNAARTDLRTTGTTPVLLVDHLATISGALGLPQTELMKLVTKTVGELATLDLANLSQLHRDASFARALGLGVEDYLTISALIGFDPFSPATLTENEPLDHTLQTVRFVHRVEAVRGSGYSIPELDHLLRQTMPFKSPSVAPTPEWIQAGLRELAAGLSVADSLDGVRVLVTQAAVLIGTGPTTSTTADALRASLLEALALALSLQLDPDAVALVPALNDAINTLTSGATVDTTALSAKFATINGLLDARVTNFIARTLRPRLTEDLAGLLRVTTPVANALLDLLPVPSALGTMAGDALLAALRPAGAIQPPTTFPEPMIELVYLLHKAAQVTIKLNLTAPALSELLARSSAVGWLDLAKLPVIAGDPAASFDAWVRTLQLCRLRDELPEDKKDKLFTLFDTAARFQPGLNPHAGDERRKYIDELAGISGWNTDDVGQLVGQRDHGEISHGGGGMLQARFPGHFADERLPLRILAALRYLKRLGITAGEVASWISTAPNQPDSSRVARIKSALQARHGANWPEVLKPMRDPLREQQRQAIVAYLVHTWSLADADDLFDHFLIDVQMSPCMMTSRLIQATASVQLFVQRVLMNLEPGLMLSDEAAEQWDWMKNYRVWEANRKVFLYPENWIEPELRDDKTPFFKDLEREILQADITNETAETALRHYLEKLHEVARLQICGHYLDIGNPSTLHVFGRTREVPHHYYYRRGLLEFDQTATRNSANLANALDAGWTAWERVDVDIEGDHLIPIVYNRRVYLFWPVFTSEDEAPMTRTLQSVLSFFGKLVQLQIELGNLIQGIFKRLGLAVIGATTTSIVRLLEGFDNLKVAGVDIVDLSDATTEVKRIRRALLSVFGLDPNISSSNTSQMVAAADLPDVTDLQSVLDSLGGIIPHYEDYLLSYLPAKRLEVQMAWSEYRHDNWTAKRTSANVVTFRDVISTLFENLPELPGLGRHGVRRLFTFRAEVDDHNELTVRCAVALPASLLDEETLDSTLDGAADLEQVYVDGRPTWLTAPLEIGHFLVNTCSGQLVAVDTPEHIGFVDLFSQATNQLFDMGQTALQTLRGDRQLNQSGVPVTPDDDPIRPSRLRQALDEIPLPKHFLPPHGELDVDHHRILALHQTTNVSLKQLLFFYQDMRRTFLCVPNFYPKDKGRFIFFPFYHPYSCDLLENLARAGVSGVYQDRYTLNTDGRARPTHGQVGLPLQQVLKNDRVMTQPEYAPVGAVSNSPDFPRALRPIEEFSFSSIGAYAHYNWEIFFHIPLLIATRLSTNQKFREAQHWFHHIFNPTDASRGSVPERYWRTRPFVERAATDYAAQEIDALLRLLNAEAGQSGLQELEWAVRKWRDDAFNPHLIARTRPTAFQKTVVMKYIDNLIAWGDSLFRRANREDVNEALQLYVLAAKLLGPRPRRIPKSAQRKEETFRQLEEKLDAFSNALVAFESHLPASGPGLGVGRTIPGRLLRDFGRHDRVTMAPVGGAWRDVVLSPSLQNVAADEGLYFCVPANDKLLAKWDLVADRLLKIRHCRNIDGGALQLPLLSPPIDPAILVRAKAMGLDLDSVLNQLYAPMPHYRFQVVLQKATELCGELRSLGAALLAAMEKRDGEAIALLRNTQERTLLEAVQAIKEMQVAESKEARNGLQKSRESAALRLTYYERLSAEFMNPEEGVSLTLGAASLLLQVAQFGASSGAAASSLIPDIKAGFVTTLGAVFGGDNISGAAENTSAAIGHLASILTTEGGLVSTMGGYRRRAEEWLHQAGLADKDLNGIEHQIKAAEIRQAIAEADLENHKLQIRNNQELQAFMQDKFTSAELYEWMVTEVASLHFQTYQMAYELAKQSERTWAHELGAADPGIIKPGYWDSLKKGLLAGEHLHHDLKRLDVAYLNRNAREYELTKNVSLRQLNPLALLELRATGRCSVALPETLFDMDTPGHYFRRIKTVALSIPCITGPYASVNCTLTLLKHGIRRDATLSDGAFAPLVADTDRVQSIVTSSAQNDSGLLETNLRDERYLPFENAGVVSEWQLELPARSGMDVPRQFDYETISDVILHLRYTARDGGGPLRTAAAAYLNEQIAQATAAGCLQLVSVKHDFPNEWARFQTATPLVNKRFELKLVLRPEHYPFWSQGRLRGVTRVDVLARASTIPAPAGMDLFDRSDTNDASARKEPLTSTPTVRGLLTWRLNGGTTGIEPPASPVGELVLCFDDRALADLWIVINWNSV